MRTDYTQYPAFAQAPVDLALSVNEVLDDLAGFAGMDVSVGGTLRFDFEGAALDHFPESERRNAPVGKPPESSSVWLYFGSPALQSYESQFRMWNGARVIVRGLLNGPLFHGGCGYLSAWPAELMAYSIRRLDKPEEIAARSLHPVRRRLRRDHQLPP